MEKIINLYGLLFEAPIDAWAKKYGANLKTQAAPLAEKFKKYSESIFYKDITQYGLQQLQELIDLIETAQDEGLNSEQILNLTKEYKENPDSEELYDYKATSEEKEIIARAKDAAGKDWFVAMPHTTRASCALGKNTEWCTARTKSQNLFLNYVGRPDEDIILFYVIKRRGNPVRNQFDKMSVGFTEGEQAFDQGEGTITVTANNNSLSQEQFEKILGKTTADYFLQTMKNKSKELNGKHPAKKEVEEISKNFDSFISKVQTFKGEDEKKDFLKLVAANKKSKEVAIYLIDNNIQEINMNEVDFTGINLSGKKLYNSSLKNANLTNANLTRSEIDKSDLTGAILNGVNMEGASLVDVIMPGADFSQAKLNKASLWQARLKNSNFYGSQMSETDLSDADLSNANFESSRLNKVNFNSAILHQSIFNNSISSGLRFSSSEFYNPSFIGATIKLAGFGRADLSHANLTDSVFDSCIFSFCSFDNALIENTKFVNCTFQNSRLNSVDLSGMNFLGNAFDQVTFSGANLKGSDFSAVDLETCDFEDAIYDNQTKFPPKFKPNHRMQKVETIAESKTVFKLYRLLF